MSVEENERYWEKTQDLLQNGSDPVVRKPKLTEKLLKRPPFRFLHDVISAIQDKTGFAKDLFDTDQRDAKTIDSKDSKLAYLQKILNYIRTNNTNHTDNDILSDVNPLKIIAGLEPEKTNLLLQEIGKEALKHQNSNLIVKKEIKPKNRPVSRPSSEQRKFIAESSSSNNNTKNSTNNYLETTNEEIVKSRDNGINILNLMEEVKNYNNNKDEDIIKLLTKDNLEIKEDSTTNLIIEEEEEVQIQRIMPVMRPLTARKAPPKLKQIRNLSNNSSNGQRPSTTGFSQQQMRPSTASGSCGGARPSTASGNGGRPYTSSINSFKRIEMVKAEIISSDDSGDESEAEKMENVLNLENMKKEKDELNMMVHIDQVDVETIVQGICRNVTPLITFVESLQENIIEMKKEYK